VVVILFADFTCADSYSTETMLAAMSPGLGTEVHYRAFERYPAGTPLPDMRPRTRKAHEAARFARDRGMERPVRDAIYAAHFVEGRDIGRVDVLVELGTALGLDRTELKVVLDIDQLTVAILQDREAAGRLGITETPALVVASGSEARILTGLRSPSELATILNA
jgi:predicted DsbA family dithiol-disulfide isomerase